MAQTLTHDQVNTITEAAYDADVELRHYSGRAMFGSLCLGVSGSERNAAKFLVAVAKEDGELADLLVRSYRTDSLGNAIIAYFESISPEGVPSDDEEDDDEDEDF
jgi:hypothetical protein